MTKRTTKKPSTDLIEACRLPAVAPRPMAAVADIAAGDTYLNEIDPVSMPGKIIGFDPKKPGFVVRETGAKIDEDLDLVAHCAETAIGWIRFRGKGTPPDRRMGLRYQGFQMPLRQELGDLDESEWQQGLNGKPSDPWLHQICLVLESTNTNALFTFTTTSITGRRAVGVLLKYFERNCIAEGSLPIVNLRAGSFQHSDTRVGLVHVPNFEVVGRTARTIVDDRAVSVIIDDELPNFA
jgi:hypothetical protein